MIIYNDNDHIISMMVNTIWSTYHQHCYHIMVNTIILMIVMITKIDMIELIQERNGQFGKLPKLWLYAKNHYYHYVQYYYYLANELWL